eukprot:CAMPEP_0173394634 /NCGR_PEP_ID=MMETSP1356-20130122/28637_1 /TAXON_ID=77927 ORGANISM="Hemiselmis virescens, Strain PCC157" /NCGR_SAMPLE_ID=MMETSP1356 /ASSEMBLY_ACC=CAM_ASM_000847 /LENGTH=37 /DNA_ID= /DNA_START= /DNA_END= /DNA_ORIENTATION=
MASLSPVRASIRTAMSSLHASSSVWSSLMAHTDSIAL